MTKKQIGELIEKVRKEKGISQTALAEQLGIRRQSLIEIEQDMCAYRVDRLLEVLSGLELKILIVKENVNVATMATSSQNNSTDLFIFRGVEALSPNPESTLNQIHGKKKTISRHRKI